jgi:hypothetical protein
MTIVPDLERMLTEAAERRWIPQPAPNRRGGWFRTFGHRRAAVGIVIACVASGSAVAATQLWSPELGNDVAGHPTTSSSPTPGDQADLLGVLRREQMAEDRGPEVQRTLKIIGAQLHGVRTTSIRALEQDQHGLAVTLVSITRFGDDASTSKSQSASSPNNPLCILYPSAPREPGADDSAGGSCFAAADIRAGRAHAVSPGSDGALHAHGLVPDGVATVIARFHDESTISATVHSNFFDIPIGSATLTVDGSARTDPFPTGYQWKDSSGHDVAPETQSSG